jgi:hypothetical protein
MDQRSRHVKYEPWILVTVLKDRLPAMTAKTSGSISVIPVKAVTSGNLWTSCGALLCKGSTRNNSGMLINVTKSFPLGRTAMFSTHVPLGNCVMLRRTTGVVPKVPVADIMTENSEYSRNCGVENRRNCIAQWKEERDEIPLSVVTQKMLIVPASNWSRVITDVTGDSIL